MNRRQFLHAIPAALVTRPALGRQDLPRIASCYGTEEKIAEKYGLAVHPGPLDHEAILRHVMTNPTGFGRTVSAAPVSQRQDGATRARSLGETGLWARRLQRSDGPIRIGIVGAPPRRMEERHLTPVAAGDSATQLSSGQIDAVLGLSAGLGCRLGLYRVAPYFALLPGFETWELWYGSADDVARIETSVRRHEGSADAAVTVQELTSRGIQVLTGASRRDAAAGLATILQPRSHL